MATQKPAARGLSLDVHASITQRPADLPAVFAYAFSQGGALLDMQPLDKEGRAVLSLPVGKEPQPVRVVLGPELEKDLIDAGELLRRGGLDRHIAVRPNLERLPPLAFDVGPDISQRWVGRRCLVTGTLTKRAVSGGVTLMLPVCNAAVDIYEVDAWPIIIAKLPDLDLDRLRDIIDGPWPPIHWPVPHDLPRPPEPFADFARDPLAAVALNPQPLPPRFMNARVNSGMNPGMNPGVVRGSTRSPTRRPRCERSRCRPICRSPRGPRARRSSALWSPTSACCGRSCAGFTRCSCARRDS